MRTLDKEFVRNQILETFGSAPHPGALPADILVEFPTPVYWFYARKLAKHTREEISDRDALMADPLLMTPDAYRYFSIRFLIGDSSWTELGVGPFKSGLCLLEDQSSSAYQNRNRILDALTKAEQVALKLYVEFFSQSHVETDSEYTHDMVQYELKGYWAKI